MQLEQDGAEPVRAPAGTTVFVEKGTRFRPSFPEEPTEYVPVCLPAFRPDRCLREDDTQESSAIATKLVELHKPDAAAAPACSGDDPKPEVTESGRIRLARPKLRSRPTGDQGSSKELVNVRNGLKCPGMARNGGYN